MMRKPYAVIGMSPGNSYFKDYEVRFLLQEAIDRFGECAIMVADVPAISTYMALGYPENKARGKAIPKGNNLKNRTRRIAQELGFSEDQVRIIDWAEEVENNKDYLAHFNAVQNAFQQHDTFAQAVRRTTRKVLNVSGKVEGDMDMATEQAVHYLLSEFAFLEYAPAFFNRERICYLYHRNWPVYEDYIRGVFDGKSRSHLDFLLLEAPYEQYIQLHKDEVLEGAPLHDTYSRIIQTGILRAAYVDYPPALYKKNGEFAGIFFDTITSFAKSHNLTIKWVEETGYGAVINGLSEGRFDIFCSATWPTPDRHKSASLSMPLYYSDVGIWVKKDSLLIDKDWLALDNSRYSIAITENDITHNICLTDFTNAKWIRSPQLGGVKSLLEMVSNGVTTATFAEDMTYEYYKNQLAFELSNISIDKPVRRFANCFLIAKNQHDFKTMINDYIYSLHLNGQIKYLVENYNINNVTVFYPELETAV